MIPAPLRSAAAAAALGLLASCYVDVPEPIYSPCAALASKDWTARVVDGPHPERWDRTMPALVVSGTVTLPSGGYVLAIEPGPVLDLNPPVQQVILRTTPPDEGATEAVSEERVSGRMRWRKRTQSVVVRCGDGVVAEIPAIEDARGPR